MNEYDINELNTLNFDIVSVGCELQNLSEEITKILLNKKFDIDKINDRLRQIKDKDEDNFFTNCDITFVGAQTRIGTKSEVRKYYYGNHKYDDIFRNCIYDTYIIAQHGQSPRLCYFSSRLVLLREYFDAGLCYNNYCTIIKKIRIDGSYYYVNGPLHKMALKKIKKLEHYWYIFWAIRNGLDKNGVLCKDVYYWIMKTLTQFF